jgi:hypothetical protein
MTTDGTPVTWHKSSFSQVGDCVELAYGGGQVFVRDSKNPTGHVLVFNVTQWAAFIESVKSGRVNWSGPRIEGGPI